MRTKLEQEGRVIIPDADMYTNNFRCMFVPNKLSPQQVRRGVALPRNSTRSNRCSSACYCRRTSSPAGADREYAVLVRREAADRRSIITKRAPL
jgi:hypothetical protein